MTNANIMMHSSYDNLSLITPNTGNSTTHSNLIFDELQGRNHFLSSSSSSFFYIYIYISRYA